MLPKNKTLYEKNVQGRSLWAFYRGLLPRIKKYLLNSYTVWLARRKGAIVGECVTMPYSLAKRANSNLVIGDHSSIQTDKLDLRARIEIGTHVIIGSEVEILTVSHNIDSPEWEPKYYGIKIDDYCWLATRVFVLPSCRHIEEGAVCAAGSVIVSNVECMSVVAGNPAIFIRKRKMVHSSLCVESLLSNDYLSYKNAYKNRK